MKLLRIYFFLVGVILLIPNSVRALPIGYFYWHVPAIRINANTEILQRGQSVGTGFHVTAGSDKRPNHFADIGLFEYNARALFFFPVGYGPIRELTFGYAYHYRSSEDARQRSHNIQVGTGGLLFRWAVVTDGMVGNGTRIGFSQTETVYVDSYGASGVYLRLAYFYAIPRSKKHKFLVGLNLSLKSYLDSNFTALTSNQNQLRIDIATGNITASSFNSMDLSLIMGTDF